MQTIEMILPEHWASALINDDQTGMDESETRAFFDFIEYMVEEYGSCRCLNVSNDEGDFRRV